MTYARLRKPLAVLTAALLLAAAAAVSYFRLCDPYELQTLDVRFHLRPRPAVTGDVVLIEIGDDTIRKLGRFPFDRSYHALLVRALSDAGARSILFDIFFSEPQEHDKEFAQAIGAAKSVYLPSVFDVDMRSRAQVPVAKEYLAKTLPELTASAAGVGHINIGPDVDGKFRRLPPVIYFEGKPYPYISFLAGLDLLGIPLSSVSIAPGRSVNLGNGTVIPLDERSNMLINFSGKWGDVYRHYSYVDILKSYVSKLSGEPPLIDLGLLKGKICIVGLTAAGTVDLHPNPFETLYPGVGIHAEVLNSMLSRRFISRPSRWVNLAVLILLAAVAVFLTMRLRPLKGLLVIGGLVLAYAAAATVLFAAGGIWVDLFYPVVLMMALYLAATLFKYVAEWKHRLLLEGELEIAKKIQESFLPQRLPSTKGIEVTAMMFTAKKVGGDLYDFVELSPEKLGVMIGDVSGKGIPASLFMAMTTGKFRSLVMLKSSPHEVLAELNELLVKESSSNLFVTMFYLIFDLPARRVRYSNGGHLPVIKLREGEKPVFLDCDDGAPLGLLEGPYATKETDLAAGDTFILYTDGVTEAMNARNDMYEKERLTACAVANRALPPKDLACAIEKDVRKFEPKGQQHDDITIMVVRIA